MSSSATTKAPPQRKKYAAAPAQPAPETIMPDRNDRIREIAYFLWLEEGCPKGQADRHWLAAETLLDSDPLERKRMEGEPPGEPVATP
jgi:Protein of unknown function (DUF2934)